MYRITMTAMAAALMLAASIAPAEAGSSVATYQEGPSNGDERTFTHVDTGTGEIMIFQHNTRVPGTVHCTGEGPRATLAATEAAGPDVSQVLVSYVDAFMTANPIIDVLVTGKNKRVLGHSVVQGPLYYESGAVLVPLFVKPKAGETMRVLIGLQVHAGCLPHPLVLGVPGSRFLEGARVTFPSYSVS